MRKYDVFAVGQIKPPFGLPLTDVQFALHPTGTIMISYNTGRFSSFQLTRTSTFTNPEKALSSLEKQTDKF